MWPASSVVDGPSVPTFEPSEGDASYPVPDEDRDRSRGEFPHPRGVNCLVDDQGREWWTTGDYLWVSDSRAKHPE